MKKNEIKHLTSTSIVNSQRLIADVVIERVKNTTYGTPRYEVIVITEDWAYKTLYEGYLETGDIATHCYNKIKKKLEEDK